MNKVIFFLLPFILLLGIFTVEYKVVEDRNQSFHFVDEEDHMVIADLMNEGKSLYTQMSTNHQPLVYTFSSIVNKVTQPQNIFMLVKRHREAVFIYSLIWGLVLVFQFRYVGIIFTMFFEFLKFYLFGNLALAETLAVYPLVYIYISVFEIIFTDHIFTRLQNVFIGISMFLVVFNLVPLWPLLAVLAIVVFIKDRQSCFIQIGTAFACTLVLFLFISPVAWFEETVYNNYIYAIPRLSPFKSQWDYIKLIVFPFQTFLPSSDFISLFYRYLILGTVIFAAFLAWTRKRIYYFILPVTLGTLLLANNRVINPGSVFYEGFHLLPWFGILTGSFAYLWLLFWKKTDIRKKVIISLGIMIWGLTFLTNVHMPYFWKTNIAEEHFINYSVFNDTTYMLNTLANSQDRIAGITCEPLVYWNADIQQATRLIEYYAWQLAVPKLKAEFDTVFTTNPPEFLYGSDDTQLLTASYVVVTKDGTPTRMYIRKDRAKQFTEDQLNKLKERTFAIEETSL